ALSAANITHSEVEGKAFDGGVASTLIVALSAAAVPAIVKIYAAYVGSKKHIKLKYKDVEIQGVSESTLLELVKQMCANAGEAPWTQVRKSVRERKPKA